MGATAQLTRRDTILWLVLTLTWLAEISALSTATFSSERTESFLASLLASCHLYAAPVILDALHTVLRKLAHAAVYAILSLLMYRTAAGGWIVWRPRIARLCVAAAAIYSLLDEGHQRFVPERGPSLLDCGIDTTGAILAILLIYGGARWYAKARDVDAPGLQ